MKYVLYICILSLVLVTGCGQKQCFGITGEYEGVKGGLTWCINSKESEEAGRPVLENQEGDSLVALTGSDIEKLYEIAKDKIKGVLKSSVVETKAEHKNKVRELLELIKKYKE